MAKPKVDWSQLCNEYVTASQPVTLTDLGLKYGVARETVSRKATKEQWDFQRDRFLTRKAEQTIEKTVDAVSSFAATWDKECAEAASKLKAKALAEMEAGGKVKDVAGALKIAQDMGKAAAGDKSETTVKVEGKLDLSIEQVVKQYADAGSSPVSSADSPSQ